MKPRHSRRVVERVTSRKKSEVVSPSMFTETKKTRRVGKDGGGRGKETERDDIREKFQTTAANPERRRRA